MIFNAVERFWSVLNTNFATDLGTICAAKSVTAPGGTWQIMKWQDAEAAVSHGTSKPYLGVTNGPGILTQGKDQTKRDSLCDVLVDVYIENANAALVAKQMALVPEAVMMSADRVAEVAPGVFGASVEPRSTRVELSEDIREVGGQPNYWKRARIFVPVWDRNNGL